jgi:hypothetical protein
LSGITWGGFDNFYYLFTYEDTRDAFGIPHDIRILEEVSYGLPFSIARPIPHRVIRLGSADCGVWEGMELGQNAYWKKGQLSSNGKLT